MIGNWLSCLCLSSLLLLAQNPFGGRGTGAVVGASSPNCTGASAPTMTRRWAANAVLCGGSPCANGATVPTFNDSVGDATYPNLTTYATNAFGTQPAFSFAGSGAQMNLGTHITPTTTTTLYAIVNLTSVSGSIFVGNPGTVEWRLDTSKQDLLRSQQVDWGHSYSTYASNTRYAIAVTVDVGASTITFYNCHGGTCYTDGTQPITSGFTDDVTSIGANVAGNIAEFGYLNGVSTAGIGNWAYCEYGI